MAPNHLLEQNLILRFYESMGHNNRAWAEVPRPKGGCAPAQIAQKDQSPPVLWSERHVSMFVGDQLNRHRKGQNMIHPHARVFAIAVAACLVLAASSGLEAGGVVTDCILGDDNDNPEPFGNNCSTEYDMPPTAMLMWLLGELSSGEP
jgi:hypothetical protein